MVDAPEGSARTERTNLDAARAYGKAALRSGYAFTRAAIRCVGALIDAGIETVEAFGAARRATRNASHEKSTANNDTSQER
jgi:hypothetical protein